MSLILNKIVGKTIVITESIVITEYNIAVQLPPDGLDGKMYKVRYIHHNGYTRIEAVFPDKGSFGEWLNTFNIRFERHKRVQLVPRWKRERLVTDWAFSAIEQAYATYLTEVTEETQQP
jgi:hypothetical protein